MQNSGCDRIGSLSIIASRYPCNSHPTWHVFVREIAHAFARRGVEVTVVSPLSFHRALVGGSRFRTVEDAGEGATVTVFRPRFVSMSSKRIMRWNTFHLTVSGIRQSVRRVILGHMPNLPGAIFGHFLYPAAAVAVSLGRELGIPAFVSTGELSEEISNPGRSGKPVRLLNTLVPMGVDRARNDFSGAAGFIANSTFLTRLMQHNLGIPSTSVGFFPNGVDHRLFYPRDKTKMRRKYHLPSDKFLVGFVGSFIQRKGADRVARAIAGLEGVGGVFIGGGPQAPKGEKVLFCDRLNHEKIPEMLSACDAFVLPTTDEGCCNAIIEAMACGLPIISSIGAFNDDILNPEVSIRVDPMDVEALRNNIQRLRDDSVLRMRMAEAALRWSGRFDVDVRAEAILTFINRRSQEGYSPT